MINIKQTISNIMNHFMVITFAVNIVAAIYISVLGGNDVSFGVEMLWQILIVSFIGSLSELFFVKPEEKEFTKKSLIIRMILCYIYVNIVVLGCGFSFGWFLPESVPMVVGMLICIAAVYLFVFVVVYYRDMKMAVQMNQKLMERNQGLEE